MTAKNITNMDDVYTGYKTTFREGQATAKPTWDKVAMLVTSTKREEKQTWLGAMKGIREWIGDRVINEVAGHEYTVKNRKWEFSFGVPVDDVDDGDYGLHATTFKQLGQNCEQFPDTLVWPALAAGHQNLCYDGQNFFDTEHPVINAAGREVAVSNYGGGTGPFWCLLDTTKIIKPMLYQKRMDFDFRKMDKSDSETTFMGDVYIYGTKGRSNAGYGLWQLAYGSRQPLTAETYNEGYRRLQEMKNDHGAPMLVTPNLLVVPPSYRVDANQLVKAEKLAGGASNVNAGTADAMVVPWFG